MNKKMSKRQRDIKSKLMAAISMLLVSSIMMVSSTYAWFTLSTAPEVTGIQTAVGANGNLEMALLNPDLQDTVTKKLISGWGDEIESGTSDSMEAAGKLISEANITWGNLVDVSDTLTYGLNNITLYPSQIEKTADGKLADTPLSRPVYGADGRIAQLRADTLTASYVSGTFSNEGAFGVRAVGTASSMTAREMAHRAALTAAANATTDAKSAASNALKTNGNVLAGMAIKKVGSDTATFSYAEVTALQAVVNALATSHNHIATAMKWYVVAHNIAPDTVNDSTYLTIQTAINGMTLAEIAADDFAYAKPTGFADAYTTLVASQAKVTAAQTTLTTALTGKSEADTFTWDNFANALNAIMDYNQMLLCDVTMNEVKEKDDAGNFVNVGKVVNAMQNGGLRLQMRGGSGVFADIADFCGTYSATITFPSGTSVMGVDLGGWEATMTTDQPKNPTWLNGIRTNTAAFASAAGGESTKSITDFYGYIIDLAFRTNAAGSNLLLQQNAIDRIYGSEGKNEDTLGGGASMTFTGSDEFGVTKVQALMNSLRIVFFETDTSVIIGEARLNLETAEIEGDSVTMKLAMWDPAGGENGDGAWADNQQITELSQNEAKALSVLVYLDGTSVTNADVAATGSQSMTGTMNLQFASSAELVPMEYADLKDGKSSAEGDQTITLTNVKAADGSDFAVTLAQASSFAGVKGFGVILDKQLAETDVVTATVDGQTITGVATAVNGMRGYVFAYDGTLAADTAITITATAGSGT